jgi:hypothetical protein
MATVLRLSDGSRERVLRMEPPRLTESGDYVVDLLSDDDAQAHTLTVARAAEGYMRVSGRDARATRVEVHDRADEALIRAVRESGDDVAGHVLAEHEWTLAVDEGDVGGHSMPNPEHTAVALAAAVALLERSSGAGGDSTAQVARYRR